MCAYIYIYILYYIGVSRQCNAVQSTVRTLVFPKVLGCSQVIQTWTPVNSGHSQRGKYIKQITHDLMIGVRKQMTTTHLPGF